MSAYDWIAITIISVGSLIVCAMAWASGSKARRCLRSTEGKGSGEDGRMSITAFLLARFNEDEAWQREHAHFHEAPEYVPPWWKRVDREIEAKRRIVAFARHLPSVYARSVMEPMAMPYSDHPDYRDEWRP